MATREHRMSASDTPWTERRLQCGGMDIGYREVGSGPVIVLLHGIGSGSASWQMLGVLLSQHCRVIAWDAPGYGASTRLQSAEPFAADYAAALHGFVEALELTRFCLVGHSLGAIMAAAYAARYPAQVQALLLADPAQGYATAPVDGRERVLRTRVNLLAKLGADGYAEQRACALLRPQPCEAALRIAQASMRRLHLDGFAQANWMLANDDIWRYLPAWRGPLAVLCGDADTITTPTDVSALAARMKAPCTMLAAAGHASYLDAPAAFAAAVMQALRDAGVVAHAGEAA